MLYRMEALLRYHVVLGKFLSLQLTSPVDLETLQGADPPAFAMAFGGGNGAT